MINGNKGLRQGPEAMSLKNLLDQGSEGEENCTGKLRKNQAVSEHGITWCWFFGLEKTHNKSIFPEKRPFVTVSTFGGGGGGGGGGGSPCDVSLNPKNLDFSPLIMCCWLELDMPSLDVTESKIGLS